MVYNACQRIGKHCYKRPRTGTLVQHYGTDDYSRLALTLLMYDTRMSWGMKFAGEV